MGNISTIASISSAAGNASAITGGVSTFASAAGLLLVTPQNTVGYQPQSLTTLNGQPQPLGPSILFHYEGENTATLESDITDHYTEDNTAIQDQIALRPIVITTQGFIGELNNVPPSSIFAAAYVAAQKLTVISGYTPGLSITALEAYNEALFAYQTVTGLANSLNSAWSSITGGAGGESVINGLSISQQANQTKQQQYFQQFYLNWINRTLFTVQTPWAVFQNMAIKSLRAIQAAETNVITDFELTFKQMRFASTTLASTGFSSYLNTQARLQTMTVPTVSLGSSALTSSPTSFSSLLP